MRDIIIFGPPGSGKGTQAAQVAGYKHVSTGSLFRQAVADQTELGKQIEGVLGLGTLISDEITLKLVEGLCDEPGGIVWDGFPRTIEQARAFVAILQRHGREITHVINLSVPEDVLRERVLARNEGRPEDNPVTFDVRLRVYESQSVPVLAFYGDAVTVLDGTATPKKVAAQIAKLIA